MNQKVSAVVLNYNSRIDCERCLRYLSKQQYDNLEIIIVDNASPDPDEKKALQELALQYHAELILNSVNNGFSAGNNLGLRKAIENKADWCMIINPDVELRDINYIKDILDIQKSWPESIVIGSDVRLPSGERQNPQRETTYLEGFLWPIEMLKSKLTKKKNMYLQDDVTGYCDKVCGACFFIKASAAKEMGYLDENVFMYSEEAILSANVRRLGKKLLYVSGVTANHEHYTAKKANSAERMIKFLKSREYYYVNYGELNSLKLMLMRLSLFLESIYWQLRGD
ncbi:glycosyltransferase family 2 protein [Ruminococcus sp. OM05-10BH]|nr:glycosyltransferase family 2 protein [Ruminococcus sp. OM05-10BH]